MHGETVKICLKKLCPKELLCWSTEVQFHLLFQSEDTYRKYCKGELLSWNHLKSQENGRSTPWGRVVGQELWRHLFLTSVWVGSEWQTSWGRTPQPTENEAERASAPVWVFLRGEKSVPPTGIRDPYRAVPSLATVLTQPSRVREPFKLKGHGKRSLCIGHTFVQKLYFLLFFFYIFCLSLFFLYCNNWVCFVSDNKTVDL
jgi:hypothetical protein